jgi:hypothetical protein
VFLCISALPSFLLTSYNRAILASVFLNETLGKIGRAGCSLCLVGSIIIVLHAPEDKEITTVDEMLGYALQPGASCLTLPFAPLMLIGLDIDRN